MSKVLSAVAGVALLATGIGAVAGAAVLGTSLATAVATISIGGVALSTVAAIGTIAGLAANLVGAIEGGPAPPARAGVTNTFTIDPNAGIPYVIGRTGFGGRCVHRRGYGGTDNPYYTYVIEWSGGGPIDGFEEFQANGETVSFSGGNAVGYYHDWMWVSSQLGATPEAAALSPPFGGFPLWGSAYKMSGHAAYLYTLKFDKDGKVYSSGQPEPRMVGRGVKVYDPRLDSTYPGGSGSCRALVESTYVYSESGPLHGLTWLLGRWQNGKKVLGVGSPTTELDIAAFVDAANTSDANDWKVGAPLDGSADKWNNLKLMLQAGAAEPMDLGGYISCFHERPRTSIATIGPDDLAEGKISLPAMRTMRVRVNGIIPRYRSESNNWQIVPAALVRSSTYLAEDGGEEKTREQEYFTVQDATHASQLAAYEVANGREVDGITLPLKLRWIGYRPGDCVTINLPEDGINNLKVIIRRRSIDPKTGTVTMTFRTETDAKHAWALGLTGSGPPSATVITGEENDTVVDENDTATAGPPGADGASAFTLVNVANMEIVTPNTVKKTSATGWDARAKTAQGYGKGASTSVNLPSSATSGMIALTTDPDDMNGGTNAYLKLDYALHWNGALQLYSYENGMPTLIGTWAGGETITVTSDNAKVRYYKGSTLLRERAVNAADETLFGAVDLYDSGMQVSPISFSAAGNAGAAGFNAKTIYVTSTFQTITYDAAGALSPSTQTNTFDAVKQNTSGTVAWTITDNKGNALTPGTYLSATTGDSVTMTAANFSAALAGNGATGLTVIGTIAADSLSDKISVAKVQAGATGSTGPTGGTGATGPTGAAAKTIYVTSTFQTITYDGAGALSPSTQTNTFDAVKQNTSGTVAWTITDNKGNALTPGTYLSATTGDSVTMTASSFSAALAVNGATGLTVTGTIAADSLSDKISVAKVQAGATGSTGANAKTIYVTADFSQISFDGTGTAVPATQTNTFVANKQNTSGTVDWTVKDNLGNSLTPTTTYLSSATGNSVTMTVAQFSAALAVNGATAVVVTGSIAADSISDKFSVNKKQDGATPSGSAADYPYGTTQTVFVPNGATTQWTARVRYDPTTSPLDTLYVSLQYRLLGAGSWTTFPSGTSGGGNYAAPDPVQQTVTASFPNSTGSDRTYEVRATDVGGSGTPQDDRSYLRKLS